MDQNELDEIVTSVATRTQRNVTLDDVTGRVLAYSTLHATADQIRIQAVMNKKVPSNVKRWEREAGISSRTQPFHMPNDRSADHYSRICVPLLVRGMRIGYLWIAANSHDDDLKSIFSDLSEQSQEIKQVADRVYQALGAGRDSGNHSDLELERIISGRSDDATEELSRLFETGHTKRLLVFRDSSFDGSTNAASSLTYGQVIQDVSRSKHQEIPNFSDTQHGVCLLPSDLVANDFAARLAEQLAHRCAEAGSSRLQYGISAPVKDVLDCRGGYRQAIIALQAAAVDPSRSYHRFEDVGIYEIFSRLPSVRQSRRVKLLLDSPGGEEKLELLERVYDSAGPMKDIADSLHMHRSSLYNHLQRIEKAIGADPLDPLIRLDLHAGLKLRRWTTRPRIGPLHTA